MPTNSGTTELNWNILLAKEIAMASRARIYFKKDRKTDKVWQGDSKQRLWGQSVLTGSDQFRRQMTVPVWKADDSEICVELKSYFNW